MSTTKSQHAIAFGDRLRELRKRESLSQDRLADRTGLDRSYVGSVERGERNLSLENICKIADALKLPYSSLLDFDEQPTDFQAFRSDQLRDLPAKSGVYALCDLDNTPIYVGKSRKSKAEGLRPRVRRHLTSARSDIVANRQLDVWEVAYVWAWAVKDDSQLDSLEAHLFHKFDSKSPLINGTVPEEIKLLGFHVPDKIELQVMPSREIQTRQNPAYRFPRQVQQFNQLLDYVLNTKDESHLRRALNVHFRRVERFYRQFTEDTEK